MFARVRKNFIKRFFLILLELFLEPKLEPKLEPELVPKLEELTTSLLKEINVQTRPGDYLLSIEEIVGGVMSKDSAKNYEATQGTPNRAK